MHSENSFLKEPKTADNLEMSLWKERAECILNFIHNRRVFAYADNIWCNESIIEGGNKQIITTEVDKKWLSGILEEFLGTRWTE